MLLPHWRVNRDRNTWILCGRISWPCDCVVLVWLVEMKAETLIWILEQSIKKNGIIEITNGHLLNIIKMSERIEEKKAQEEWIMMSWETWEDD